MKFKIFLCILIITLFSFIAGGTVSLAADVGIPALPTAFYGTVTINDQPAPTGTKVEAQGPGVRVEVSGNPVTTTSAGKYGDVNYLLVQGDIPVDTTIKFYVNGIAADDTYTYTADSVGTLVEIDLSITTSSGGGGGGGGGGGYTPPVTTTSTDPSNVPTTTTTTSVISDVPTTTTTTSPASSNVPTTTTTTPPQTTPPVVTSGTTTTVSPPVSTTVTSAPPSTSALVTTTTVPATSEETGAAGTINWTLIVIIAVACLAFIGVVMFAVRFFRRD